MNVNASLPSRRCACFLPSPPDSPPMSEKPPTSNEDLHYSAGLTLPPYPGGTSQQVRNRPQGSIYGGTRPGNDSGMDSYTQGGYQHGPSREPVSGRTNLVQASSAGERGNHGTHLLSPASASGFSWDTGTGTRHEPSASGSPASQYTPELILTKAEEQSEEGEELDSAPSEEEDTMEETEKTGAELSAEKRKMKRFRLVQPVLSL